MVFASPQWVFQMLITGTEIINVNRRTCKENLATIFKKVKKFMRNCLKRIKKSLDGYLKWDK